MKSSLSISCEFDLAIGKVNLNEFVHCLKAFTSPCPATRRIRHGWFLSTANE